MLTLVNQERAAGGDLGDDTWARINSTARSVPDGWMGSDGHCSNMMNPSASLIGVGYYQGGSYGAYLTQVFGVYWVYCTYF